MTLHPAAAATGIAQASPATISMSSAASSSVPNQATQIPIKFTSPPVVGTSQRKTISSMQMTSSENPSSNATTLNNNNNNVNINLPVQFNPIQFNPSPALNTTTITPATAPIQIEKTVEEQPKSAATPAVQDMKTNSNENESKAAISNSANTTNRAPAASNSENMKIEQTTAATNGTAANNCSGSSSSSASGGGGICSVLLEVIEKLRDAETLSDDSNRQSGAASTNLNGDGSTAMQVDPSSKESLKAAKKLKRKLKLDKNGNEIVKGAATTSAANGQKVKKPKIVAAENGISSEEKKLRKKRTSKKLCQLLQEKNEMNSLMQQQQTQMECSGLGQNYETCAALSSSSRRNTQFNNDSSVNECTIETSVVNSLYEDEDALLNKFDTSVSITSRGETAAIAAASAATSSLSGATLINHALAQQSHEQLFQQQLLHQQQQQLQQQFQQPKVVNINFACFRCLNLFNDLSLLGEHKTSCQKLLDQEELTVKSADDSNIYLCDLCAGGGLSSHSNAGIQFKCFNKLDMLIEHYKSDHYDDFAACLDTASSSSTVSSHSPAVSLHCSLC
jgi:hypothetical protein